MVELIHGYPVRQPTDSVEVHVFVSREAIFGGERLGFAASAGLTARVGGLCEREQECCLFFTFVIVLTRGGVTLDVTAPDGEGQLVTALLDGRS